MSQREPRHRAKFISPPTRHTCPKPNVSSPWKWLPLLWKRLPCNLAGFSPPSTTMKYDRHRDVIIGGVPRYPPQSQLHLRPDGVGQVEPTGGCYKRMNVDNRWMIRWSGDSLRRLVHLLGFAVLDNRPFRRGREAVPWVPINSMGTVKSAEK